VVVGGRRYRLKLAHNKKVLNNIERGKVSGFFSMK
jgi:hypothetical protein